MMKYIKIKLILFPVKEIVLSLRLEKKKQKQSLKKIKLK